MNLTPLHPPYRAPGAHLDDMRQRNIEPAFAQVLDELWRSRAVIWYGLSEKELEALAHQWQNLSEVTQPSALKAWCAQLRSWLWGAPHFWNDRMREWDLQEADEAWCKARLWLGEPVTRLIANDGWQAQLNRLQAQAWGYEDIEHRVARHHRERQMHLPLHPEPEGGYSVRRVREQARTLVERFGLRWLRSAADMPIEELWGMLIEAEEGLSAMAKALGLSPHEIGMGRLSLSFELDTPGVQGRMEHGKFDLLTTNINLCRIGGWGSFAHEWAHMLDYHLGNQWNNDLSSNRALASRIAADALIVVEPGAEPPRNALRALMEPQLSPAEGIEVLAALAHRLPGHFERLLAELPREEWRQALLPRVKSLKKWSQAVTRGAGTPGQWRQGWENWKTSSALSWSSVKDRRARSARLRWHHLTDIAEHLLWGEAPMRPAWMSWGQGRDVVEGGPYWDLPEERFARMFETLVADRIGRDTFAARSVLGNELFPQDEELAKVRRWWTKNRKSLLTYWREPFRPPFWKDIRSPH